MILPDHEIAALCKSANLVRPFRPENVQPASLDVTLFDRFRVFEQSDREVVDLSALEDTSVYVQCDRLMLRPGEFALGATEEVVSIPNDLVARIEGKSSVGRAGLAVHITAGFIDPGFMGRITLEMVNLNPEKTVIVHAGRPIAQLSFHQMTSAAIRPYEGRYQGDMDVVPSRYGALEAVLSPSAAQTDDPSSSALSGRPAPRETP